MWRAVNFGPAPVNVGPVQAPDPTKKRGITLRLDNLGVNLATKLLILILGLA